MALVIKDRVKETTTTTGTGTYTLAGAVSGFETFTANLSNSDTTYYVCTDNTDFEVGLGTFTSSGTTLARTTILASSNSNNAVNWSSGTRSIFMTYPADKAVFKDASNNINGTFVGDITGTLQTAAQSNITSLGTLTALTVDDVAIDGKVVTLTGSTSDTATLTAGTNGTLDIVTTDAGGASANIQITADGTAELAGTTVTLDSSGGITLDADGGTITFADAGSSLGTITSSGYSGNSATASAVAAANLTGSTLASGVTASSLTSLGTLASNLNLGGQDIVTTTSNQDIDLAAHGTGKVVIKGNDNQGAIKLNCEANSHGQTIIAAPHSESANNTLTLPSTGGDARLVSATSTATLTNKTLTSPKINEDVAVTSTATELNILDGVTSTTAELNILDGVTATASELNILDGKSFVDEDNMASDSATAIASQQSIKAYVDANSGGMTNFILEDGDGTEVTVADGKEVKFVEGGGLDINWTDTSTGSDGDPYDLTFTINASQTDITSLTNASLVIGRDADNDIDFATDNEIIFRANGADQIKLSDGALVPVTDNDIDLGTSTLEFKNLYLDGTATVDGITNSGNTTNSGYLWQGTDGAVIYFGTNFEVTLTHVHNVGLRLNTDKTLSFRDSAINIGSPADGDLDINADDEIELNSTLIDINGNLDVSGSLTLGGTAITSSASELNILDGVTATASELNIMDGVTSTTAELNILDGVTATASELNIMDGVTATTSELNIMDGVTSTTAELNILDGVTASAADINLIDGITNGTVIASKAIITDSNKDISGGRNITISGELDAATLDISGNADIDGTLEADAITVNGTALNTVIADEATALAIALG